MLNLVDISEDGNYIVAANGTGVTFFHKSSNSTIWTFNTTNDNDIVDLAISWNGTYVVASDGDQVFLLKNTTESPKTAVWQYPNTPAVGANFQADISATGNYIAVGNSSGHVALLSNTPAAPKPYLWENDTGNGAILDIAISGDGHYTIAGTGSPDGAIYLFNKTTDTPKTYEWSYFCDFGVNGIVAISEDGNYIVSVDDTDNVYLINTTNPQGKYMWKYDLYTVNSAAISYDGQYVVLCYSASVVYFNTTPSAEKQPMWTYWGGGVKDDDARAVDISADGKYVVYGASHDSNIHLFNSTVTSPKSYEWIDPSSGPATQFWDVAISAAGNYFVGVSHTDLYLYHHDRPPPPPPPGLPTPDDDDDDDDDDEEAAIPFGNFYLVFMVLGMISLIIIMKRKMNIQKNN